MQAALDVQQLINAIGDAIVVCDASGAIILWNPGAEHIFGFTEQEAIGHLLDLIIPERLRKRHWDGYHKSMETGQTRYGNDLLKVPAVHKDGRKLSIAFTVAMLYSPDKKISAIASVIRDETSRFEEERALRSRIAELESKVAV